jgi:hypothetical protein
MQLLHIQVALSQIYIPNDNSNLSLASGWSPFVHHYLNLFPNYSDLFDNTRPTSTQFAFRLIGRAIRTSYNRRPSANTHKNYIYLYASRVKISFLFAQNYTSRALTSGVVGKKLYVLL